MDNKHNANLDILRGTAAILVVLFHLVNIYGSDFDKHFTPGNYLNYNFPGHLSVLVFFILSGYVIRANTSKLENKIAVKGYIRKRLTRILPIYIVAIVFTAMITYGKYSWTKILSNFFFISVPLDNVYVENGPVWSLNYELIYYFVFIIFSWFSINLVKSVKILFAFIAISFTLLHNSSMHPLIISYTIGFLFWITGAMLAELNYDRKWELKSSKILALFVMLLCLSQLNPFETIMTLLHVRCTDYSHYSFFQQSISWNDLFYWPFSIILILALTHSYSKYGNYLLYLSYLICMFQVFMMWKNLGLDFIISQHYLVPSLFLFSSMGLWFSNFNINPRIKAGLKKAAFAGKISYGIYLIHVPLIFCFGLLIVTSDFLSGLKFLLYFLAMLFAAFLLEDKYQLWVKQQLKKILDRKSIS